MGGSSKLTEPYSLPPNTTLLHFPRSDGSPAHHPADQEEYVHNTGDVNFFAPLPDDLSGSRRWLHALGNRLAAELGKPAGEYAFAAWPDGYCVFDHHKGPADPPSARRHDAYLYGSSTVLRFRSVNEFAPHALWLLTDPALDTANCRCQYCARRPAARLAPAKAASSSRLSSSRPQPETKPKPAPPPRRRHPPGPAHPHITFQRTLAVRPPTPAARARAGDKPGANGDVPRAQQAADLRAARATPGSERVGGRGRIHRVGELVWAALPEPIMSGAEGIEWWPAVIRSWRTVVTTSDEAGVQHHTSYEAQLLASNARATLTDLDVLPYAAWHPSPALIAALRAVPPARLSSSRAFAPAPGAAFADAAGPYCVTLSAAVKLSESWGADGAFDALLEAPELLREERCQGLWWGPERIWAGDTVALKVPRAQLRLPGQDAAEGSGGGVFMRVDAFAADEAKAQGWRARRRLYACGPLFELVVGPADGEADAGPAPAGLSFRALLPAGTEARVDLAQLGGRIYPALLAHPRLAPLVSRARASAERAPDAHHAPAAQALLALAGLAPGMHCTMSPARYVVKGRAEMVRDALRAETEAVEEDWAKRAEEEAQHGDEKDGMDMDDR